MDDIKKAFIEAYNSDREKNLSVEVLDSINDCSKSFSDVGIAYEEGISILRAYRFFVRGYMFGKAHNENK